MTQPIFKSELSPSGQEQSQPMSSEQFGEYATAGRSQLNQMQQRATDAPFGLQHGVYTSPADRSTWEGVKSAAYQSTREDWGGQTINPRTSNPVDFHKPDKHAVTVRESNQPDISVSHNLNEMQFGKSMDQARRTYSQLGHGSHYLGVFHDTDLGRVDIDPVVVTHGPNEEAGRTKAMQIAAASHATGGAYHFASGNGVWPPHVKEG